MQKVITAILISILSASLDASQCPQISAEQCKNIFRIDASGCLDGNRTSTGFSYSINKNNVIITTLHGVVGCKNINAKIASSGQEFMNLKIYLVEIEKDLVALTTNGLVSGSFSSGKINTNVKRELLISGFPLGNHGLLSFTASNHDYISLKNLLNNDIDKNFQARKSPLLKTVVLGLQTDGNPGMSGAPVIDNKSKKVVAIFNGGRLNANGIYWGIPIANLSWKNPDNYRVLVEMKRLEALPLPNLLSSQPRDKKGEVTNDDSGSSINDYRSIF